MDPPDDGFFDDAPLRERVRMHLAYTGAPGCAEAELFKDAVRIRAYLWGDPFAPFSRWRLTIRITRNGPGYDGSGELRTPEGALRWRRTFRGSSRCYDVIASLALSVTLAIMPEREPEPPPAPPPACTKPSLCLDSRFSMWPESLTPLPKPKLRPPLPERWPLALRLGVAAWPEVVVTGWGSLGLSVDGGVRYRWFSAGAELHGDPPLESESFHGVSEVRIARISGALLLCGHWGWFVGCGIADVGRLFFLNSQLPASAFYGAAGMRAGLEFPVAPPRLFLRAALDLRAPIRPASDSLHGAASTFLSTGLGGGLGIGVVVELPP